LLREGLEVKLVDYHSPNQKLCPAALQEGRPLETMSEGVSRLKRARPMKITRIDSFAVRIPLIPERRMISALGQHTVSEYAIIRVSTDVGIDGVGEATVMPRWSGETVWSATSVVDHVFAPALIGVDPCDVEAVDARMDDAATGNWFAKSAIEMACWDIHGKDAGKPVYELLGGAVRDRTIKCRFSMGAYPPERTRSIVPRLIEEGFETIKVKVGTLLEADIERVRIVRELIGPNRQITIDANCGWDVATSIAAVKEMHPYNVVLFEQPTPRDDYAGLAEVRRNVDIPVMADDIVFDLNHARECIRNDACDLISLYPGKNGGIRKAREIAKFAEGHGVACSIGSNLEWDIASAAMCHLVVATPNMQVEKYPGDILGPKYHEFAIVKDPLTIEGPCITCPDQPGLGVTVEWPAVEKHSV